MKQSQDFALEIRVNGSNLKQYFHQGRFYVEGRKGSDFTLHIFNGSNRRVLAVPTVDGLSVIDGKTGSFESKGYILDRYQSIDIPGWRLDDKKVAGFFFASGEKSYANDRGGEVHNGVVGCAFYFEKEPLTMTFSCSNSAFPEKRWEKYRVEPSRVTFSDLPQQTAFFAQSMDRSSNSSANVLDRSLRSSSLGTGFGEEKKHEVVKSGFDRASDNPSAVLSVYYDTRQGLLHRGINLDGTVEIASPFPKESWDDIDGYCKPPVGWKG